MAVIAIIGGQWGHEGRGKIINFYTQRAKVVVRCQGGHNVEQTLINERGEFHLRLLPGSVFYPQLISVIGSGVIVDPVVLLDELEMLQRAGIDISRVRISNRAHVIMPYHILLDRMDQEARGETGHLGTRARGVRLAYADKVLGLGITLGDLLNEELLLTKLSQTISLKNRVLSKVYSLTPLELHSIYRQYLTYGNKLARFILETSFIIQKALETNRMMILEGAEGALLDVDYGTYPYVGSTPSTAAGLAHGAGIGPGQISQVVVVFKAYCTRAGPGPMPSLMETSDAEMANMIRKRGGEYATVTAEPRRVGWFDAVAGRYVVQLNSATSAALTHLDVLDHLPSVKICTGYRIGDDVFAGMMPSAGMMQRVQPVYETLPGWDTDTGQARSVADLPPNARAYVQRIEDLIKIPVSLISVGRDADQVLQMRPVAA